MTFVSIIAISSRILSSTLYFLSDSGKTTLWNNWFLNTFDEYQLGIVLVIASFLWKRGRLVKDILLASGVGLLIAEAH